MKNMFFNSVLVAFVLLVASCSKQPEAKVDVMSFNIRLDHVADSLNNWKYRKDAAAQMIIYYAPDVVGMQEVLKNQLDDLKNRLPQYTVLGVGRADGKEKGEYCSLFYKTDRFDLVKSGNFGLSETPDSIGIKGWDAACERIVTWAVLKDKVSGKELAAFNTHFDHIGKVARRESAVLPTATHTAITATPAPAPIQVFFLLFRKKFWIFFGITRKRPVLVQAQVLQ